jgi:four helix bundle protein
VGTGDQGSGTGAPESRPSQDIRDYRDLKVWQEAMTLVRLTYKLTKELPRNEEFGLSLQMTRATVSVPANIAEGHSSHHRKVFLNHLSVSRGSLAELETYFALLTQLEFVTAEQVAVALDQSGLVGRLLNALIRALNPR